MLCLVRPHVPAVKCTWVTAEFASGSSVTKEQPVRFCGRCGRLLEVLDA